MLVARDFRYDAWEKLSGNWGTMALATFLYSLIAGACSSSAFVGVGAIAGILIAGPFALGFAMMSLSVIRTRAVELKTMFDGFTHFVKAFVLALTNGLLIFLWSLLLFIPGIIKSLSYSMSFFILADHPELTANEARQCSMEMMDGNKWRLFCLYCSFIGWFLLCIVTFGILSFWVAPYVNTAVASFYQSLQKK